MNWFKENINLIQFASYSDYGILTLYINNKRYQCSNIPRNVAYNIKNLIKNNNYSAAFNYIKNSDCFHRELDSRKQPKLFEL